VIERENEKIKNKIKELVKGTSNNRCLFFIEMSQILKWVVN